DYYCMIEHGRVWVF
nr:immunoglobulin light chain junction region [Macaca mulatta]MOY14690.1 immunoglobulin light chain junction region [Macaca mulatta]MOY14739.1 immunoglobulin light chain junction region [Macaca mulatta]MOY14769.1 immunoglobulin light chain junction region [Macaca mulatta]MOY14793.1 immunoglobulin light chain junction region [Macaca mulatta]